MFIKDFWVEGKINRQRIKEIAIREVIILSAIVVSGYVLEVLFLIFHKSPAAPALSFWKDKYAFEFWNNSLRENAQIIRFLGYPFFLLIRGICWMVKLPEVKEAERIRWNEGRAKGALENIAGEIRFDRKVVDIIYKHENLWYVVRFDRPPSCIIPRVHIDNYINSGGEKGKREIIDLLLDRA